MMEEEERMKIEGPSFFILLYLTLNKKTLIPRVIMDPLIAETLV